MIFALCGCAEVERDAALVAIDVEEQAAFAAFGHGADPAVFAALAPLDAYHVSAKIRQHHRAIRRGDEAAKIDHADSFKRSCHIESLIGVLNWLPRSILPFAAELIQLPSRGPDALTLHQLLKENVSYD